MGRLLAWVMLAIWASWIAAFQGLLAAHSALSGWVPDFGLVLALACAATFDKRDTALATLIVACGRIAYSIEPPAAVLAGFLFAGLVVRAVATVAEVEGALVRTILAALAVFSFAVWLQLVHQVRDGASEELLQILPKAAQVWPMVCTSAGCALLMQRTLVCLPGLSPLRRPRW